MALGLNTLELDILTADPGSPSDGEIWYNSTIGRIRIRRGGANKSLSDLGELTAHTGSTSNPHTTTLEQARTAGNTLSGVIDMGSNAIQNVGGSLGTDASSRQFVTDSITAALQGLVWQQPVNDRDLYIPPGGPGSGDRYIVNKNTLAITAVDTVGEEFEVAGDITTELVAADTFTVTGSTGNDGTYTVSSISFAAGFTTIVVNEDITDATVDGSINYASGAWNNKIDDIVEWDGAAWVFTTPIEGYALRVLDEDVIILYDGTAWGAFGSAVDHNTLLNLTAGDPHTQYLPVNGTRAMAANLSVGGFSITNVNLVDGVDVSDHSARHDPGGADALTTASAVGLSGASVNGEGTNASFARSDHTHEINKTDGTISTIEGGDGSLEGTGNGFSRRDHQHAVATGAGTDPVEPDNTAAEGTSTDLARADHAHTLPTAAPIEVTGATNSIGTANSVARSDHQHRLGIAVQEEGTPLANTRPTLNFIGANVTAADDAGNDRINITVTAASGAEEKAGNVAGGTFAGNPKKATVTFGTAYAGTDYAIAITCVTTGNKTFAPAVESKTNAGFVINMGSNNVTGLTQVEWQTSPYNDP